MSQLTYTNGAAPSTPASGKTTVFVNTSKRLSQKDDTGLEIQFAAAAGSAAVAQSSPADPTGPSDATGKMMGLAGTITPGATGRIHVTITGTIANATAIGDGATCNCGRHGQRAGQRGRLDGHDGGRLGEIRGVHNSRKVPFTVCAIVTGLTVGVARWIDVGLADRWRPATVKDISVTALSSRA
jgi:hypothetical protein